MVSKLDQLKNYSVVVADTGDIESIKAFAPTDCTTNPTLVYKASGLPQYRPLVDDAVAWGRKMGKDSDEAVDLAVEKLAVNFGKELAAIVPGRVSTEVDADLSFNTDGTIAKARRLIKLYEDDGVGRNRILIKVGATWEGIRAAEVLEKEGINCNLTLVFSLVQAVACAEAGAFLISPFVGRILDWYKQSTGKNYGPDNDPGVESVHQIYSYFKKFGYDTVVMGASFRGAYEIERLAGCDRLTISPALLKELADDTGVLARALSPDTAAKSDIERIPTDENAFRWQMNEDEMATAKLSEGIRLFHRDTVKLRELVAKAF